MKFVPQNVYLKALIIALIYVGFGTLTVCSVYPDDTFYLGGWAIFGMIITFPVSIISFGYRYANANDLQPVFIIQLIMFLLTYLLLAFFILKKRKAKGIA
jgi:hypothetical protein